MEGIVVGKEKEIEELLSRGVDEVIIEKNLRKELGLGKRLRVKFGIDPTAPDIHLGHTVPLRKLKQFQDLGHQIVLIVGDFTATIGDPSGRSDLRKSLTRKEVKSFMKGYEKEIGKVIDINKTEVRYNSEWYDRLGAMFLYELTSKITVARILERDDFQKRIREDQDISMLETIYPLLQGYDSVEVNADIELGGTDQKFNLLMGRKIQKRYGKKEQNIMTTWLLEGTDGVNKMSKSLGNYIGISEEPNSMYGKAMSIPDSLIIKYFRLLTDVPSSEIDRMKKSLQNITLSKVNPRDFKVKLAKDIVTIYHGEKEAKKAADEFENIFKKKEKPTDIPKSKFKKGEKLVDVLVSSKTVSSKSEVRRLIQQGGVRVDDNVVKDIDYKLGRGKHIVQVGKRRFVELSEG